MFPDACFEVCISGPLTLLMFQYEGMFVSTEVIDSSRIFTVVKYTVVWNIEQVLCSRYDLENVLLAVE